LVRKAIMTIMSCKYHSVIDAMEIVNSTLTALEQGKISVSEAQQLTGLALAKMNIESRTQADKAASEQISIDEAKAFAIELD